MSDHSERITALIKQSGMSYQYLEKITGIKKSSLQRYASGATAKIPMHVIEKLSAVFNVSVDYLITGNVPNGVSFDQEENPHVLEISDTAESLKVDDQIFIKNFIKDFAKDPEKMKASLGKLQLTEVEALMLKLFRQIPEDRQGAALDLLKAALKMQ